jgi:hypothetical protein
MSKEAALRAMREASYAARTAGPAPARKRAAPAPRPAAKSTETAAAPDPSPETDGLCGHRSMNGRSCTREHGHAAKSHRYG